MTFAILATLAVFVSILAVIPFRWIAARRVAALGAFMALAACGALGTVVPGSALTPSEGVQIGVADGSLVIDSAYNALGQVYLAAAPSLPAATKAKVKADFLKILSCTTATPPVCTGYLQAAHDAAKVGDQTTLNAQLAQVEAVIAEIKSLLPAS